MSSLRATERRVGLLINFRAKSLEPQRVLNPRALPDPAVARRLRAENS